MKNTIQLDTDLTISRIITGLWQIADMERSEKLNIDRSAQRIAPYVDAGLTTFDMADHYGSSELIVGQFSQDNPNHPIQLLTKWVPQPGKITKDITRKAVELALTRMKQTSIDLIQYHAWYYPDPSWLDALFFLTELKNEGLIKNIGVTNFDSAHLRIACASGIPIVTNQVSHSVIDQRVANGQMGTICNQYGVKLLAYGVVMGGFLTEKWLNKKEPKNSDLITWSEMKYKRFIDSACGWDTFQKLLNALDVIAQEKNVSIANICSRLILQNPSVAGIIIGARLGHNDHIEDNLSILEIEISDNELKNIADVQKELIPIQGDCGDEYRRPPFLTASGDLSHHIDVLPSAYNVQNGLNGKKLVSSKTSWEDMASYSRAVRIDDRIIVSGTTATHNDFLIGGNDVVAQTHFIIDKIEASILSLGGNFSDIIRTRIFIKKLSDWEQVAIVHGLRFKDIMPANTLVKAELIGDGYLVEIEAEAKLR